MPPPECAIQRRPKALHINASKLCMHSIVAQTKGTWMKAVSIPLQRTHFYTRKKKTDTFLYAGNQRDLTWIPMARHFREAPHSPHQLSTLFGSNKSASQLTKASVLFISSLIFAHDQAHNHYPGLNLNGNVLPNQQSLNYTRTEMP